MTLDPLSPDQAGRYRRERKFAVSSLRREWVESIILQNPAGFTEIYHPRWVNNIYLDSWQLGSYHENLIGVARDRIKVRIRWYGTLLGEVEKPVLELKIRQGSGIRKEMYPIHPLTIGRDLTLKDVRERFQRADLPESIRHDLLKLEMKLVNRYRRRYFLSSDGLFRVTVDSDLSYHRVRSRGNSLLHLGFAVEGIIVELKFTPEQDASAPSISDHLPFRLTRSSKYVSGIECLVHQGCLH